MKINIGGIAAAYQGFRQGAQDVIKDENAVEDRAYLKTQRANQVQQQDRMTQAAVREDTQRAANAAIPANIPQDEQYRRAAAAARQSGDIKGAFELHQQADKFAFERSTKKFQQLAASGAANMPAAQLAKQAAELYNTDSLPEKVVNIKDDGNGGVSIDLENKENGTSRNMVFKNSGELLSTLHSYYSPQSFAALQAERFKAQNKVEEELRKPVKLSPSQELRDGTGKLLAKAPPPVGAEYIGEDANGDPMYRKMATVGGAGAGAGKAGKGGGDPVAEARGVLKDIAEKSEDKLTTDQRALAEDHVARLVTQNPNVPPAMAARAALAVAKDPTKLQPKINHETGKIDMVFEDGPNGNIAFQRGAADAVKTNGIPRDTLVKLTSNLLQEMEPKEREGVIRASRDRHERRAIEDGLRAQAEGVIAEKTAGVSPEQATAIRQHVEAALDKRMDALNNHINMVYNYGPKAPAAGDRQRLGAGGLATAVKYSPPANSPAARARASRDQARAAADAKAAAAGAEQLKLSAQFQEDAKTLQPLELARKYDSLRAQLPRQDAASLQAIERTIR